MTLAIDRKGANRWQVVGRAWYRRGAKPDWVDEIKTVVAELEHLNRSTEADFLAITDRLTHFLSAARIIAAETRALADSLSGQTGAGLCEALAAVVAEARRIQQQAAGADRLAEARDTVTQVRRSLRGFERVGPSFQVMATLVQIETAHLGSAGMDLGHLGEEFRSAGEGIRTRAEYILQGAAAVEARIVSALREASGFNQESRNTLPALIATAEQGLNDFRERQAKAVVTVGELARLSDLVAKAIGDLVASIQFHDITRQKVEHIIESLNRLAAPSPADRAGAAPPPAAILDLQVAQLENARAVFVDAVRRMDQQIGTIAGQINQMVAEGGSLLASSDSLESSFYLQMESCFRAIADTAGRCLALEQRTRGAVADLRQTLQKLQESAREIHAVELRLRWLAINAGISACHIGAAGEPLEAVAGAMHQLVLECEGSSAEADEAIGRIAEAVLAAAKGEDGEVTAGTAASFDHVRARVRDLQGLNERSANRLREIASVGAALSADVEAARQRVSAAEVFMATAQNCCDVLRRLRAQAVREQGAVDQDLLREYQEHYTMSVERDVHEAVTSPAGAAPATLEGEPAEAQELAGSVELF